jgi:hypothetical protein
MNNKIKKIIFILRFNYNLFSFDSLCIQEGRCCSWHCGIDRLAGFSAKPC